MWLWEREQVRDVAVGEGLVRDVTVGEGIGQRRGCVGEGTGK